jgi:hypothetical protein
VDFIMDNLIVAGKAKPMIIVTDNLNAAKPGERAVIFAARGPVPAHGATTRGGAFADPAAFNKKVRVLGTGSAEGPAARTLSDALTQAGIHNVYFKSPAPRTNG